MKRPGVVTCLAVLQFIGGAFGLVGALFCLIAFAGQDEPQPVVVVIAALFVLCAGVQIVCGIGLLTLKPYGRILQIVIAIVGLVFVPVGTILSIAILVYLFKPGAKVLFSGKPATDLTPDEVTSIDALLKTSVVATVLIGVVTVLGGVAMLAIIAAITIPALIRARQASNEAAALGAMRIINSAEVTYATAAGRGGYATALATLAKACPGSGEGFVPPDLAGDPTIRAGYAIRLESAGAARGANDCNGVGTEANYYATATPLSFGTSSTRAFSAAAGGTVFYDASAVPPSLADTLAGTALPVQPK